jgi:hypothetical protein
MPLVTGLQTPQAWRDVYISVFWEPDITKMPERIAETDGPWCFNFGVGSGDLKWKRAARDPLFNLREVSGTATGVLPR